MKTTTTLDEDIAAQAFIYFLKEAEKECSENFFIHKIFQKAGEGVTLRDALNSWKIGG